MSKTLPPPCANHGEHGGNNDDNYNRINDNGAEFAVHSWRDEYGREASDFSMEAPQNRTYLNYYREMGMDEGKARAFYAMTNSVPHHRARWMRAGEMREWVGYRAPVERPMSERAQPAQRAQNPRIAYLSLEVS